MHLLLPSHPTSLCRHHSGPAPSSVSLPPRPRSRMPRHRVCVQCPHACQAQTGLCSSEVNGRAAGTEDLGGWWSMPLLKCPGNVRQLRGCERGYMCAGRLPRRGLRDRLARTSTGPSDSSRLHQRRAKMGRVGYNYHTTKSAVMVLRRLSDIWGKQTLGRAFC